MRKLPHYPPCFVCGNGNLVGLDLDFYQNGDYIEVEFVPSVWQTGYPDMVHNGIVAALLDEAMGWAASLRSGTLCMTAELSVRFLQGLLIGTPCKVRAYCERQQGGVWLTRGEVLDTAGQVCARAEGSYSPLPEHQAREFLSQWVAGSEGASLQELFPEMFWSR